jgi:hypothetical protein
MTNSFKLRYRGAFHNNALMQGVCVCVCTVHAPNEVYAYIQFECIIPNELQLGVAQFGLALPVVERGFGSPLRQTAQTSKYSKGRFDPGRRVSPDFQGSLTVIPLCSFWACRRPL